MNTALIRAQLEAARDTYMREVDALAELVRESVVIPYCNASGRRFSVGMGSWSFDDEFGNYYSHKYDTYLRVDIDDDEVMTDPIPANVADMLSSELLINGDLGERMQDYTPPNYCRVSP